MNNTHSGQTFTGPIIVSGRGYGYFKLDDDHTFEVQPEKLLHAFHRDEVEVKVLPNLIDDKVQAEVVQITSREKTQYVGVIQKGGNHCFLVADSHNMYVDIYLGKDECSKAENDDKALIEITEWEEGRSNPTGKIIEVLGKKGVHDVEMRAIVLDKGFETGFSEKIEAEAAKIKEEWTPLPQTELDKRKDMRDVTTFTIDPFDAKDFDDALSLKKLDSGNYEIGIHIADVSHFVTPGSALDDESFNRSFSVYLVDRTIPMLPEVLSNNLCSLNPDEDKLSFSAVFEMTPNAEVVSKWFGRTVINSDRRFTYEEAQQILDAKSGDFIDELIVMQDLSRILRKNKLANGAIRFERDEFEFDLDENGVPLAINKSAHIETHGLIEEFMLLANRQVSEFIFDTDSDKNGGSESDLMYRVHAVPEAEKIKELKEFVFALGYKLNINKDGSVSPNELNNLLKEVKDKPEEGLISTAAIKTMSKAKYETHDAGHFGLSFDHYTHFTSPIRRYPDLVVHRVLQALLDNMDTQGLNTNGYTKIASQASEQEVAAADAERTSIKYKQIEFLQKHVGDTFKGVISGVTKFGIFVVLDDNGAQGLVHISKLGDEYFNYDEKHYRMVGEQSHAKYTLGDPVKVQVAAANLEDKKLDFEIVK